MVVPEGDENVFTKITLLQKENKENMRTCLTTTTKSLLSQKYSKIMPVIVTKSVSTLLGRKNDKKNSKDILIWGHMKLSYYI